MNFNQQIQYQKNWDSYSKNFSPQVIMKKFNDVFISGEKLVNLSLSAFDKTMIQRCRFERKIRNLQKKLYL